jgi:hypothetical protein
VDAVLLPAIFVATKVKAYVFLLTSPLIVHEVPSAPTEHVGRAVIPGATAVTVYPVIADPPVAVEVSKLHEISAELEASVAVTDEIVGWFGTV